MAKRLKQEEKEMRLLRKRAIGYVEYTSRVHDTSLRRKYGGSDTVNSVSVEEPEPRPLCAYITQQFFELLKVIDSLEFGVSMTE